MTNTDRILITGGTGLIGRNLRVRLESQGFEVVAVGSEHDLRDKEVAAALIRDVEPTVVFHLAARVGGIYANTQHKPDFYSDNVLINTHVLNESVRTRVRYFFAMGTGCAYPKRLEGEVLYEENFLDGIPEPTNDAYAYAKRGLLAHLEALAEDRDFAFCYCLPANLYGPHDNFHPTHSHVVPGLIRRFSEARDDSRDNVAIWGDGSAKRDFLYVGDAIAAIMELATKEYRGRVNVARGVQTTIQELAEVIGQATGFEGEIVNDLSFPSGQSERQFDTAKVQSIGWSPSHDLETGIRKTVEWFEEHRSDVRER